MNHSAEHTGSYYADTINNPTDFAPLQGELQTDVCVIGAGFTGISTALHLAERGYKVVVLESHRVGWGASGRNGGQMIHGIAGEKTVAKSVGRDVESVFADLRWEGHNIIQQRVEQYGIDCDFKRGYLDVAIKPRHIDDMHRDVERLQANNFPYEVRIMSREETRATIGTDAFIAALLNMGNGHLHPLNLCIGEANAAVSLGAQIFEHSAVTEIQHVERPVVKTTRGQVSADSVILAGNAYHALGKKVQGTLFPVKSFQIATESLSEDVVAKINPQDLAVCDPNFVLRYFRLTADKRLLFGSRINYSGDEPNHIRKQLRKVLATVYPELREVKVDYAWGGHIGVTINPSATTGSSLAQRLLLSGLFWAWGKRDASRWTDHG